MSSSHQHGAVEARSFDHVPESERGGSVRGQAKFWFMVNATLITAYTGAVGPLFGMGLPATVLAIVVGTLFGTLFQAFHGAQGPHMGLPQMIQSRVQFGSRGAILPIAVAAVVPIGFAVFYLQTGGGAAASVLPGTFEAWQLGLGILAGVLAIVGYRLILAAEGVIAYVMLANLVALTVAAVSVLPLGDLVADGSWSAVGFLAQLGASAGYQIAIAPIVSDYTRYLPSSTRSAAVSAAVFVGTVCSALWIEVLGAAVSLSYPDLDVVVAIGTMGDAWGFGLGTVTMVVAAIVCLVTAAVSVYSGTVSLLSGAEAFKAFASTPALRAWTISIATVLVIAAALALPGDVLLSFSTFLLLLGYLLIPWTAVNLTDYYLVRRGVYSVSDILRTDGGIYGRWGVRGMASYGLGVLCMVPFVSTTLYTGPVAASLGGADIAFAVGLVVSGTCYALLMRSVDLASERAHVSAAEIATGRLGRTSRPSDSAGLAEGSPA
ncbi:purine-cytosine permease family protein [Nocardioides bruguierae]|uniref:purine-cytosine permease family protein n=1 Tax=Nocardioides bruguierae TaxID=2945102 RepID=UPI002020AF2B|nr:cytosine permease [Nocardioides bruguierae]MCL8026886.1 cytosine permease [Nocardioides bruguierae]